MDREKLKAATDYVIIFSSSHGIHLNLIKLQRLLYMAYAWHLAFTNGRPLFEELFQAWKFGPVNHSLQQHFVRAADPHDPITAGQRFFKDPFAAIEKLEEDEVDHMELIMNVYGDLSASELEEMLLNDDPWTNAREGLDQHARSDREITDRQILAYYHQRAQL